MIEMIKQHLNNFRFAYALLIIGIPCFLACEKKSIAFGENLAESYTNIIVIDSVTPSISTIRSDSFLTSNTNTIQLGNFKDSIFGSINARSFFHFNIPAVTTIGADAIFDSLTLKLVLTKDYYGDTSITQQINVNELTSKIEYTGENTGFYNTSSIPYSSIPLGTKQYNPKPNKTDTLEIRLSDAKGREFLKKLEDQASEVTDQTYFLEYFKGIALSTAATPSSIIGYSATDSTLKLRLYYTERDVTFSHKFIDFNFTNPQLQFNQITIDRSNTVLASLPKNTEIPSLQLGHAAYLQPITGLFTKIRFPSLPDLLLIKQSGKILKAQLIIKPVTGTFSNIYRLPPELNLVTTDKYNSYGTALTNGSTTSSTAQNGSLTIDDVYGENTNYTYDVTNYLQQQITVNPLLGNGLLLYPPTTTSNKSFNRLVIGDNASGKDKIQLKIFYLAVD